ncbi:hypothetical protein HNQ94_002556 [Salirhabdus euzebyi]|uniref:Uncharacterized protein n=1 Tax=Salirhabdus euzebyi TaxID=394506 RepID=A0A841Q6V2_9BACI|nr:hypothetical protein [Salirhabdus euzebyi]MBB6454105.1 hypothetical protein [Salirhabdus euzebyi]
MKRLLFMFLLAITVVVSLSDVVVNEDESAVAEIVLFGEEDEPGPRH